MIDCSVMLQCDVVAVCCHSVLRCMLLQCVLLQCDVVVLCDVALCDITV